MGTRAEELAKMLGPLGSFGKTNTVNTNAPKVTGYSILFSLSLVIFVIFLLLLLVHYTITPIFIFKVGDMGYIPLSNTNDGQLVWTTGPAYDLSANVTGFGSDSFTIQQDLYLDLESTAVSTNRVFSYRSNTKVSPTGALLTDYPATNLLMYVLPNTNDITISAITQGANGSTIESAPTLLNVPIRQPFRLTVVLLPQYMEVYLNGKLNGTKTFQNKLKTISANTYFFSPPMALTTVKVANFQLWNRPLSPSEIANAGPVLPDSSLFNPSKLPVGGTCH